MKRIEHKPVNWVNGLKLTSSHFLDQYFSHTETANRILGHLVTKFTYGLGEPFDGMGEALEIEISSETLSSIVVTLKSCNAVTRGGLPILYYEGLYGDLVPSASLSHTDMAPSENGYVVMVSVEPDKLIPVGIPDAEVAPLHHPYVLPSIRLHIVPKSQVNKAFYAEKFLPVAEINSEGGALSVNQDYIPPVQRSGYHDGLSTFISQLSRMMRGIKGDIRQIYSKNVTDKRRDELAGNTFILCDTFARFFDTSIFWIEEMASEESPVRLIQAMNTLANSLNSSLLTIPEVERERLLQYYYDWTNVTPSDFLTAIDEMIAVHYDHTDIAKSLHISGHFISLLNTMFHKMSELEYIGIIRENIVMGDESSQTNELVKKRFWTFMK